MKAQLVIFCKPDRLSAKIQHFFAKDMFGNPCHDYPYHGGILVGNRLYDMSVRLRNIDIEHYSSRKQFRFELPFEADEYMLDAMVSDGIVYGVFDTLLYPIFSFLNWNGPGTHCTEWCNDVMWWHGFRTSFNPLDTPPTPCQLLHWATLNLNGYEVG